MAAEVAHEARSRTVRTHTHKKPIAMPQSTPRSTPRPASLVGARELRGVLGGRYGRESAMTRQRPLSGRSGAVSPPRGASPLHTAPGAALRRASRRRQLSAERRRQRRRRRRRLRQYSTRLQPALGDAEVDLGHEHVDADVLVGVPLAWDRVGRATRLRRRSRACFSSLVSPQRGAFEKEEGAANTGRRRKNAPRCRTGQGSSSRARVAP